jgi:hypothetical protein
MDLREELPLYQAKALDIRPTQGTFDIPDARIIAGSDPFRSTLFYRISKTGSGRMPHIGSEEVDERGVQLLYDWIRSLPVRNEEAAMIARLVALDPDAPAPRDPGQVTERRHSSQERRKLIKELLGTPTKAVALLDALKRGGVPQVTGVEVLDLAAQSGPAIRGLFDTLQPESQRVNRLGNSLRPSTILEESGDAHRGATLFYETAGIQCKNCHRVGQVGGRVGPDLSAIGSRLTALQLLESIRKFAALVGHARSEAFLDELVHFLLLGCVVSCRKALENL